MQLHLLTSLAKCNHNSTNSSLFSCPPANNPHILPKTPRGTSGPFDQDRPNTSLAPEALLSHMGLIFLPLCCQLPWATIIHQEALFNMEIGSQYCREMYLSGNINRI